MAFRLLHSCTSLLHGVNVLPLGTMTVKIGGKQTEVQVIDVVAQLIVGGEVQLKQVKELTKDGVEGLSVMNLTQIANSVSMTT